MEIMSYTSAPSLAALARILAALADGPQDTAQLIAASGYAKSRGRALVRYLAGVGCIYYLALSGAGKPAVWALVPAVNPGELMAAAREDLMAAARDEMVDGTDNFQRRVIVRQQWAPNHVRMPLVAALFGVPVALQGAAA